MNKTILALEVAVVLAFGVAVLPFAWRSALTAAGYALLGLLTLFGLLAFMMVVMVLGLMYLTGAGAVRLLRRLDRAFYPR